MGASQSSETTPTLDAEQPEVDEEVVDDYEENYEEVDTVDSLFLYWWY
jgi:hypothetical protein